MRLVLLAWLGFFASFSLAFGTVASAEEYQSEATVGIDVHIAANIIKHFENILGDGALYFTPSAQPIPDTLKHSDRPRGTFEVVVPPSPNAILGVRHHYHHLLIAKHVHEWAKANPKNKVIIVIDKADDAGEQSESISSSMGESGKPDAQEHSESMEVSSTDRVSPAGKNVVVFDTAKKLLYPESAMPASWPDYIDDSVEP